MSETPASYGSLPQSDFESQYKRILEATGCRTQIDLATVLEIRQSFISDAKRRQSIPSGWFLKLFEKRRISPEWLRTGQGDKILASPTGTGERLAIISAEHMLSPHVRYPDDFINEQEVLNNALLHLEALDGEISYTGQKFAALVVEYSRLLQRSRDAVSLTGSMSRRIYELQELIQQDPLTSILNRRYLEKNLDRIVKTLCRSGSELGVLMIDIDFFKQYNDLYGHGMGDAALKKVAGALKRKLTRMDDFVVRYGGEEFTVILPNTGEKGTRLMAERMLASVRDCNILYEPGSPFSRVTVSVGATSGKVTHDHCGEDFIRLADAALYQAKDNGRDGSVFWGQK